MRSVAKTARLGLVIVGFGLLPTQIGLQDLGSLIAPRRRHRARGGIDRLAVRHHPCAAYHFPGPPAPTSGAADFRLASLDPNDADVTGSIASRALIDPRDDRR